MKGDANDESANAFKIKALSVQGPLSRLPGHLAKKSAKSYKMAIAYLFSSAKFCMLYIPEILSVRGEAAFILFADCARAPYPGVSLATNDRRVYTRCLTTRSTAAPMLAHRKPVYTCLSQL